MTNVVDFPASPVELLRSFLRDVDDYEAVVCLGLKKDGAAVAWSRIDLASLTYLERALAAEVSKEFDQE
jgi:hypothetical protein